MGSKEVVCPDSAKIGATSNDINRFKGLPHHPWHHSQAYAYPLVTPTNQFSDFLSGVKQKSEVLRNRTALFTA